MSIQPNSQPSDMLRATKKVITWVRSHSKKVSITLVVSNVVYYLQTYPMDTKYLCSFFLSHSNIINLIDYLNRSSYNHLNRYSNTIFVMNDIHIVVSQ